MLLWSVWQLYVAVKCLTVVCCCEVSDRCMLLWSVWLLYVAVKCLTVVCCCEVSDCFKFLFSGSIVVTFQVSGSSGQINSTVDSLCSSVKNRTVFNFRGTALSLSNYLMVDGVNYHSSLCIAPVRWYEPIMYLENWWCIHKIMWWTYVNSAYIHGFCHNKKSSFPGLDKDFVFFIQVIVIAKDSEPLPVEIILAAGVVGVVLLLIIVAAIVWRLKISPKTKTHTISSPAKKTKTEEPSVYRKKDTEDPVNSFVNETYDSVAPADTSFSTFRTSSGSTISKKELEGWNCAPPPNVHMWFD